MALYASMRLRFKISGFADVIRKLRLFETLDPVIVVEKFPLWRVNSNDVTATRLHGFFACRRKQ